MDIPKPPDDLELKNIIDKLANFVARNGPEFESMTKQKQKDNLKFSFLYGGEFYNYYQHQVNTERAVATGVAPMPPSQPWQSGPPPPQQPTLQVAPVSVMPAQLPQVAPPQLVQPLAAPSALPSLPPSQMPLLPAAASQLQEQLQQQRTAAQNQITQSEQNLAAQYTVMIQQQQIQIDEAISNSQKEKLKDLSVDCDVSLDELDSIVRPIIDSCTKDAISNGKNWIFQHCTSSRCGEVLAQYLAERITAKDATFETKLHLIYLMNDVLHHCMRKNADDLKNELQKIVVPAFCSAHLSVTVDKQQKLVKLLNLWDQNHYFDLSVIEQMREPSSSMSNYQASLITDNAALVTEITQDMNRHYTSLQKQHQDFVTHLTSQLALLDQQIQQQLIVPAVATSDPGVVVPSAAVGGMDTQAVGQPTTASIPVSSAEIDPGVPPHGMPPHPPGPMPSFPPHDFNQPPPNFSAPPPGFGPAPVRQFDYAHGQASPIVQDYNHGQSGPSFQLPDFTKPPPGFSMIPGAPGQPPILSRLPMPPVNEADLTPSVPYFELPAGLMAPLVNLEDCGYKPLVSEDIRLPPPMPPSERLLAAVEAFYSPPSHERPRDSDGWEKLALYEFFRAKQHAKRAKEDQRRDAGRDSRSRSRSRSRSCSRSRSRSPSPRPRRRRWLSNERKERSRSRSRSPPSDNDLPYQRSSRSPPRPESRQRSRSRSRSPSPPRRRQPIPIPRERERSVTPPTFQSQETFQTSQPTDTRLGSENRGHQLLMKMGWGGKGLGSSEQGRVDPVDAAEVRDRTDMYKGIGVAVNDPFEQFRKSKAKGFVQRMRAKEDV